MSIAFIKKTNSYKRLLSAIVIALLLSMLATSAIANEPIKEINFSTLPIFQDTPVSMVNNPHDVGNPPVVAFSDSSCPIPGQLSIVQGTLLGYNPDQTLNFKYVGHCVSLGAVSNIVLKTARKYGVDYLYIAYYSKQDDMQLIRVPFDIPSNRYVWPNVPEFPVTLPKDRNPIKFDLAVDSKGNPTLAYIALGGGGRWW